MNEPLALSRLGKLSVTFIAISTVGSVWDAIGLANIRQTLNDANVTHAQIMAAAKALDGTVPSGGEMLASAAFMMGAISFVYWFHSRFKLVASFPNESLAYTSGQAVLFWFIPLLNFFLPERVAQEMWRASDPGIPNYDSKEKQKRNRWIEAWWLCFLIRQLLSNAPRQFMKDTLLLLKGPASQVDFSAVSRTLVTFCDVSIGRAVVTLLAGALVIWFIIKLEQRQEEKRRLLPPPVQPSTAA